MPTTQPTTSTSADAGVSLFDLPVGRLAMIIRMDEEGHAMMIRLKTMGMHNGRAVRKVRSGSRLIVSCGGTRIGMTADVARHILVQPLTEDTTNPQPIGA